MKDQILPDTKWQFNEEVTASFDDMLERSIPQYDVMRKACFDIACIFVKKGTDIVDLGCSRGEAIAPLISKFGAHNRFIGLEISEPMLEAAQKRFEGFINCGIVQILKHDLREEYPLFNASVTQAILTLQFVPIEYRQRIIRNIYQSTCYGGVFLMVEKVIGNMAEIDRIMVNNYYNLKAENGYSQEQIERKRLSLEGVLVPVTANWNEELLRNAGFRYIDCFWRWMNFAGWLAIKDCS